MIFESVRRQKPLPALLTAERFFVSRRPGMDPIMIAVSALGLEPLSTHRADEWMKSGVAEQVGHQTASLFEASAALGAAVALEVAVGPEVRGQTTSVDVETTADWTRMTLYSTVSQLMNLSKHGSVFMLTIKKNSKMKKISQ